jgi:AhpC/TSA family
MLGLLLAAALTLAAQDAPPPAAAAAPAAAKSADDALAAEFDKLQAEYSAADKAYWASLPRNADGDLQITEEQYKQRPDSAYAPRFLELGRRAGKTETGASALAMALRMVDKEEQKDEVLELLTSNFLDSPKLAPCLSQIGGMRWTRGSAFAAAKLRDVRERSKNPDVKAAATFELAQVLMDQQFKLGPGNMAQPTGAGDPGQARALFIEVRDSYADTHWAKEAAGCLFELDHLQVGMVAPDFEAKDQDGQSFKLSDYRGKVVLLDFWGFW